MLNLFKEQELALPKEEALRFARNILISHLNKGSIPEWDQYFQELPCLNGPEDLEVIKEKFKTLTEWDFLEEILSNESTEYFFHGIKHSIGLSLGGGKFPLQVPLEENDWQIWLEIISIKYRQNWNVENPFCSFYGSLFGKQFRFSMVHSSTSPGGISKLMLRSLASSPHSLSSFGETTLLPNLVKDKKNILIAGATGSGKTSLLTSLLSLVDTQDHLVILEDTYEILFDHPYQTRFLSGENSKNSLKSYLAYAMRLSPDRIILGEMRSHEVAPFLMAMNTGHRGLMGTIHASSGADALHRVALLFILYAAEGNLSYERVMELLCRNLDYVIFMEDKKVKEIIKILGSDKGTPFFETITGHPSDFSQSMAWNN
jgi:type IV secretion system protein VirB11